MMMRKVILTGLLAAAMIPSLAQAQDHRDDRRDGRQEHRDGDRGGDRGMRDGGRHDGGPRQDDRRDFRDGRGNYRADWRDYRRTNPGAYRSGGWNGPRGHNYRRVPVGYQFDRAFYDRRYWVDPYRYHLRPVASWQRWVRYGNDVALIDVRSGRVLDINYGFFF